MSLVSISRRLAADVDALPAAPGVAFTYNPLVYARRPHETYLKLYGGGKKQVLLLGMNPGPFGMAQTGVPFGDVTVVRDWMGISESVSRPEREHPKRPVQGFACSRREVSGTRLWGLAKHRFKRPELFFSRFFVVNYCPLVFMDEGGRNVTPDKLPGSYRDELYAVCDAALKRTVAELDPEWVIGVGAFAMKRAQLALDGSSPGSSPKVGTVLHPSPASPRANRGWEEEVTQQLAALGIRLPAA